MEDQVMCEICGKMVEAGKSSKKTLINERKPTGLEEIRTCGMHH